MRIPKTLDYATLSPDELTTHADRILGVLQPRVGRKRKREYPFLSERQIRTRQDKELPMYGPLLEAVIGRQRELEQSRAGY